MATSESGESGGESGGDRALASVRNQIAFKPFGVLGRRLVSNTTLLDHLPRAVPAGSRSKPSLVRSVLAYEHIHRALCRGTLLGTSQRKTRGC
jgi:hypothetical protein